MFLIRRSEPINIVVHGPKTQEGRQALAEKVADAHAQMAAQYIGKCKSPNDRKRLAEAILSSGR